MRNNSAGNKKRAQTEAKLMIRIISLLIVTALLVLTGCYLSFRLHRGLSDFFPRLRTWPVMLAVFLLIAVTVLGFVRALIPFPVAVKQLLGICSAYSMGILVYLLMYTLAAEMLLALPRILKLSFTSHALFDGFTVLTVLLLTVGTCAYGFINARQIDNVSYEIALTDKKDISDIKLTVISDLHLGSVGSESRLEDIVSEINSQQPDVICIAGDFFDTDFSAINDTETALEALRGLHSTYGVYACLGNHDGGETHEQMKAFLKSAGIQLLDDSYTVIDGRLLLAGRLDASPIGGYGAAVRLPLTELLDGADTSLPTVIMDHNPANIDEYGSEADLILCGHTHKGQIFPGNLFTHMLYTVDYGYYRKDLTAPQVIVTSGVGTWGMPMRVGTDCETVTVTFKCE